jgi:hypothetical protein
MTDTENGDDEAAWRFGLDEVGEDAETPDPILPGSPTLEHTVFVILGALVTVAVIYRLAVLVSNAG